ncbi:MAG: GIY-YIG nuclease family protein [Spirochaetaceae bacterium]|jgi:hypothetical protein|nr:GIY-YIG nuclease family protein [Spirochaetaceae bacterium]
MDKGILYVVFNKWINNPETHEMPYKIGITRSSVDYRYYGLGLKMPGKFETLFAYKLDDCAEAEQLIHGILNKHHENGEWFNITQKELDLIKANCEVMGGKVVTDEVVNEIEAETEVENEDDTDTEVEIEDENEDDSIEYNKNESINIKGINIPLHRKANEKTQDFVIRLLHLLFNNRLIPETEIQNMLNKEYSVKTFGISFSILQNDKTKIKDRKKHTRYWTKEIFGNKYYACSQWWKEKNNIYGPKLLKWIEKIDELNKK